jgi:hypothetical protein
MSACCNKKPVTGPLVEIAPVRRAGDRNGQSRAVKPAPAFDGLALVISSAVIKNRNDQKQIGENTVAGYC